VQEEYYHLYNRGNDKQILFKRKEDWARFLFLLIYGQSALPIHNTKRHVKNFIKKGTFDLTDKATEKIFKNREVELIAFSIMPNHFHILAMEITENGISKYMQRVQIAYAMYFNKRNERSGHVFQGSFGSTHIEDNEQLLYVSAYIHLNPIEVPQCKDVKKFEWSSYQDYLVHNRWGELLKPSIILDQYKTVFEYEKDVSNSDAKKDFTLDRI